MTNRKWPAKISHEELQQLINAMLQESQRALGLAQPIDARHRNFMCCYAATKLVGDAGKVLVGNVLNYRGDAALDDQGRIAETVLVCFSAVRVREAMRYAINLCADSLLDDDASDEYA